jgi:hypothetical protein
MSFVGKWMELVIIKKKKTSIEWQQCEIGTISGWIYMEEGGWKETIFRGHMVKVFYTHECKRTTKPAQFVPRG